MRLRLAVLLGAALMLAFSSSQAFAAAGGRGKPDKAGKDKDKPGQPDHGKPDDPGRGKPDDPGGGHGRPDQPDNPDRGKPDDPGGSRGKPDNPGGDHGKPDDPGRGKPDHPDGGGAGKGPQDRPPGWDKGQKRGWDDIYPPGWNQKADADRERWRRDVDLGRDDVARTAEVYGVADEDKRKHQDAFEVLVRKGKELEKAREDTIEGIKKGNRLLDVQYSCNFGIV